MIVDRTITIAAPAEDTFQRVTDIPFVGSCLPGAADVRPDGEDTYAGRFSVKVGPVKVNLEGTVRIVELDEAGRRVLLRLDGTDRRIGGNVVGDMDVRVDQDGEESSTLVVHTDMTISGKLGQFGQAVMIKKADQITETFVEEFSRRMSDDQALQASLLDTEVAAAPRGVDSERTDSATPSSSPPTAAAVPASRAAGAPQPAESIPAVPTDLDPVARLHDVLGLLRRGRRIAVVRSRTSMSGGSVAHGSGQIWVTAEALADGFLGESLNGRDYVVELAGKTAADVAEQWRTAGEAGLDQPVAVALRPAGDAIFHASALAELCTATAYATGRAVLPVASTPWSLLNYVRLTRAGLAQAVVADLGPDRDEMVTALFRMSIGEARRAGLNAPVLVGPVGDETSEKSLRSAGADAVLVESWGRRSRWGLRRR